MDGEDVLEDGGWQVGEGRGFSSLEEGEELDRLGSTGLDSEGSAESDEGFEDA